MNPYDRFQQQGMAPPVPQAQPGMMHTMGTPGMGGPAVDVAPVMQPGGGMTGAPMPGNTGVVGPTGMNWGGLLGHQMGDQQGFGGFGQVRDALSNFRDARQDWRQGGREGPRPTFMNYLFPNGGGLAGMGGPVGQMPVLGQPPVQPMPAQGVGTGVAVGGMVTPASPFTLPGYGG